MNDYKTIRSIAEIEEYIGSAGVSRQRPVVAVNTTFSNIQKNWHLKMWLDSVTALMYAHRVD